MEEKSYKVILFYKFVELENPKQLRDQQYKICQELGLKGRTLISTEGVNGTFEGETENINKYIEIMKTDSRFSDVVFKISPGDGLAFPKLTIKVRKEVVTLDLLETENFDPKEIKAKYLEAEQLHDWIHKEKKEFYIVDMRNYYEAKVGKFAGSIIFESLKNFRELPKVINEIDHLKDKTIVTVCTGGIRCDRGSGFLLKHGFKDVYQLHHGIVTYMEKYPNEDFLGKLYVFDSRVMMGFNLDSKDHQIIGKCEWCGETSENYVNYNTPQGERKHGICCQSCISKGVVSLSQQNYYSYR